MPGGFAVAPNQGEHVCHHVRAVEDLLPGEDEVVASLLGEAAHCGQVRAALRLGEALREPVLAPHDRGQVLLSLLLRADSYQELRSEVSRSVEHAHYAVRQPGEMSFFLEDGQFCVSQPAAAG